MKVEKEVTEQHNDTYTNLIIQVLYLRNSWREETWRKKIGASQVQKSS